MGKINDTNIKQIEKTYYHTTEEKMVSNALAGYYVKDGLLIVTTPNHAMI